MIESLLVNIPVELLAIDPGLTIVEPRLKTGAGGWRCLPPLILVVLLMIDPYLDPIASELFTITDGLLELAETLLSGKLLGAFQLFSSI
jgi:hypothetical protein